jgi:hypothetical protein
MYSPEGQPAGLFTHLCVQLVQTGKAIKASQKDGARNGVSTGAALRTKMPETMKTYHYALDDLESEIVR